MQTTTTVIMLDMATTMEPLMKEKAQYNSPPRTNQFRPATLQLQTSFTFQKKKAP